MTKAHSEGAQRACSAAETLARMRPHMFRAGITRLGTVTGMDRLGIPVAQTSRPDAVLLSVDSGKGVTTEQALASALMEGFERSVGEQFTPKVIWAEESDAKCVTAFPRVAGSGNLPNKKWAIAKGILSGKEWFVPLNTVIMRPNIGMFETYCCWSNGLSSGNNYEEAVVGGLYEVMERDAVNSSLRATRASMLDLSTISDPVILELLAKAENAGCKFNVLDVTNDLCLPTYHAYLYDFEDPMSVIAYGSGAHLSPAVAVSRALCEAAQARAVWMTGTRDDIGHEKFTMARKEDNKLEYERLQSVCDVIPFNSPNQSGCSFDMDIQTLIVKLEAAGMPEPLVVRMDDSHDFPCSVVKILAPGLAGYYSKGCRPGRPK